MLNKTFHKSGSRPYSFYISTTLIALIFSSLINAEELFKTETLLNDLNYPWSLSFLGENEVLITEKTGSLIRFDLLSRKRLAISGAPESHAHGQGGLLDVLVEPKPGEKPRIYLTFTQKVAGGYTTALASGFINGDQLQQTKTLLSTNAVSSEGRHFGSRLAWDDAGYLYMSVGDRGNRNNSQDLMRHAGKVLRLTTEGKAVRDNPFYKHKNALPEIYSLGHRNPQGMAFDSVKRRMWLHEHGPKGGDELNHLEAGANYGWPLVTFGREYWGGEISPDTKRPGIKSPHHYWVPSIAPSGLAVYNHRLFPKLSGHLLVGALKFRLLAILSPNKNSSTFNETRHLEHLKGRIRDVKTGPNGEIYLLTDAKQGKLLRLTPR